MKSTILKTVVTTVGILLFTITTNAQTSENRTLRRKGPSIDTIFEKMDVDKDAKLTAEEVKGPLKKKFTLIDADADGFITKEEMENAPKPKKPTISK